MFCQRICQLHKNMSPTRNSLRSSRNGLAEEWCHFVDVWSTGKESFTSFMVCRGLWGRIFCFLTGDTLGVLDSLRKNLLLPSWGLFKYALVYQGKIFCLLYEDDVLDIAWSTREESSASLLGIVCFWVYTTCQK